MNQVYLALGSNVGDSVQYLSRATDELSKKIANIVKAPIYSSQPVGHRDQPDFLNTAIKGKTDLTPQELLVFVKEVEKKIGRVERFRWGPREIDIDIILYGDQVIDTNELQVPHQSFRTREFVLRPLNDLSPNLIDPVTSKRTTDLLDELSGEELSVLKKLDQHY